jgi:hypothetical protein
MTWTVDLRNYSPATTWMFVKVYKQPLVDMIKYSKSKSKTVYSEFQSRASDLTLNASQTGTVVTIVLTIANLNRTTDETGYRASVTHTEDSNTIQTFTSLIVNGKFYAVLFSSTRYRHIQTDRKEIKEMGCFWKVF